MGATALVFIGTMLIGVPIAFVLGASSLFHFLFEIPIPLEMIGQKLYSGIDNYVLLAIPFFMFAGELMNRAKITESIFEFADLIVGRIPGGLAQANCLDSVFFAGITGSGVADTAALGSIEIPVMVKAGYKKEYAAAVTIASSVIGPIIPPSIVMVVYSTVTGESIRSLFAAGFIPGILIALSLMILCYYYAVKEKHPRRTRKLTLSEIWKVVKNSFVALLTPVILIGGIFSGKFTPTEAAAISCLYAMIAGLFILRTLTLKDIIDSLVSAAISASVVLIIISIASLFGQVMAIDRIPQKIGQLIIGLTSNKYIYLLLVNILCLFMGMIMETSASVILLAPILVPIAINLGIHPLHFALVMLVNLNIGLITPPVGVCIYAASAITGLSLEKISKAVIPFITAEIIALLVMTYVPDFILFLPRILGYI